MTLISKSFLTDGRRRFRHRVPRFPAFQCLKYIILSISTPNIDIISISMPKIDMISISIGILALIALLAQAQKMEAVDGASILSQPNRIQQSFP